MDINQLSSKIIGSAIEVHKALGPGLLESSYQKCLCHELGLRGIAFESEKPLPLFTKEKNSIVLIRWILLLRIPSSWS